MVGQTKRFQQAGQIQDHLRRHGVKRFVMLGHRSAEKHTACAASCAAASSSTDGRAGASENSYAMLSQMNSHRFSGLLRRSQQLRRRPRRPVHMRRHAVRLSSLCFFSARIGGFWRRIRCRRPRCLHECATKFLKIGLRLNALEAACQECGAAIAAACTSEMHC